MLPKASTAAITNPTPPLFFELDGVTATTILLTWGHPADDGGTSLCDMELSYTEIVPKEHLGDGDKGSPHKKVRRALHTRTMGCLESEPHLTSTSFDIRSQSFKGLSSKLEEKHHKFLLGSYMEEYMMIDLRGDNDYKDIQLVAINKAQYRSDPVEIKLVHTKPPSSIMIISS